MLRGIDISNYQAGINLAAVPADFVIVKVSDGIGWTQPYWRAQADAALAADKRLGLYHWAHGAGNQMANEAEWFAQCVARYAGRAVLFLDWEDSRALSYGPVGAKEWLDSVFSLLGVTPVIYLNGNGLRSGNWTQVAAEYPLWCAGGTAYDTRTSGYSAPAYPTNVPYWGMPAVFQFTQFGRLPGYGGDLDLNVSAWDAAAWDAQARGGRSPSGAAPEDFFGDATHIVFESGNKLYLACLASGNYEYLESPEVLHLRTVVLTRTGWKVKEWRDFNAAKSLSAAPRAFGREVA